MAYWLLKSEPTKYSWAQLVADGRTHWDGVKNAQALINLRAMQEGDRAFFYHSNEGREIVGIAEILRSFYPDPSDPAGKLGVVDIGPVAPVQPAVGLAAMKAHPDLRRLALIRQPRLSVCPVSPQEWRVICELATIQT